MYAPCPQTAIDGSAVFITIKYKAVHGRRIGHYEDSPRQMSCCVYVF